MTDTTAKTIIRQVESLGYAVELKPSRAGEVELWLMRDGEMIQVIRRDDGDEYKAACELAQAAGIDLKDG